MFFVIGVLLAERFVLLLTSMTGIVIALAFWWRARALDRILYRRRPFYRRGFPGEEIDLTLEIENAKWLPVSWLRISDIWPLAVAPEDEDLLGPSHIAKSGTLNNIFSLRWFERARRQYRLLLRQRGVYSLGPARLDSGDLFGFYEHGQDQGPVDKLTVFPKLVPFHEIPLPTEDPFGDLRSPRRLYEDPTLPIGIRDYAPEDDFRRVHWPATARRGELQSRIYQPVAWRSVVICLNVATFSRHWEGTDPELLEHVIGVAASLAVRGIRDGQRIGLISNGCLTSSDQPFRISPGRSTRHLIFILQALAAVTPLITSPFPRFLIREAPRLPYRASLMVVSATTTPELAEATLRLKHGGRKVTLITFDQVAPSPIPGVRLAHHPFTPFGKRAG